MSTQIEINQDLIKYLQNLGYRKDTVVDKLEKETKALGNVAQMQIAKEQGQFLEIIIKTSKAKSCLEIGRFTGLTPYQAANKALSKYFRETKKPKSEIQFICLKLKST